ncbi:MAG: DUF6504 family protein [Egibacteraceae bacterium]
MFDFQRWEAGARGDGASRPPLDGWGSVLTKRYREPIEVSVGGCEPMPTAFRWRGRAYRVLTVLGHWREDAAYWSGRAIEIPQRDLWRVEALGITGSGVYELACESGAWRLDRVWD